ncbi:MAG: SURF1 family protein [Acetobacteraceae bacterium]|nr:SURF1 family protein [Acetobacteraceae bacterium]
MSRRVPNPPANREPGRARARVRILLGPGLATLAMLSVLIGLGVWQVHRLAWKTALLAAIDRAQSAAPGPLEAGTADFAKVRVEGTLAGDSRATYGVAVRDGPSGPEMGGDLLVAMIRPADRPVLVDLGWVPAHPTEPLVLPAGAVSVVGYVRPAERPGLFSLTDDVAGHHFYTLDPARIGAALGRPDLAPLTVVALGPQSVGGYPVPARDLPRPPNNHLSYALTWFGLAAALIGVFGLWTAKVIRS